MSSIQLCAVLCNYRADGMNKSVGDLVGSHVSVNVERCRQLLAQM